MYLALRNAPYQALTEMCVIVPRNELPVHGRLAEVLGELKVHDPGIFHVLRGDELVPEDATV